MARTRHFLGWDQPVVNVVRDFLLEGRDPTFPIDLENTLVVVPTVQAGRRLREALARHCAAHGTTLLSAQTVTPAWFLHTHVPAGMKLASATVTKALWAEVLRAADPLDSPAFFGARTSPPDDAWALQAADMLHGLRVLLSDAGLAIADVPAAAAAALEELDRWHDMGRLEAAYLLRLKALGLIDPCEQARICAQSPDLPKGVERLVIASIPSPSPLALQALTNLADRIRIDTLVHAPLERADMFDDWGRPSPDAWFEADIDIPNFAGNVVLAGGPESQAEAILALMASCDDLGPADVAVGVPDQTVLPFVESALADHAITAFDPAQQFVGGHPVFGLVEALFTLHRSQSYQALADLIRHPDMLLFLTQSSGRSPRELLRELDEFQNLHIPMEFSDVVRCLSRGTDTSALAHAVRLIGEALKALQQHGVAPALRNFLCAVFEPQFVQDGCPEDEELKRVADAVDRTLRELAEAGKLLDLNTAQGCALLLDALSHQTFARERGDAMVDLEGWLELAWNDALFLIITGMNEGVVPDTRLGDVFLPDSLRTAIGLIDDRARLARDAYLMASLIASRRERGRVAFVVGKTSAEGDPLKPSRLFFRCGEDIVARARLLFGDPGETAKNYPSSISFQLNPSPPADLPADRLRVRHMSATRFRGYLACPFRFYLQHVLKMGELDDTKAGLDAADFGNLVHDAMSRLGEDEVLRCSEDEGVVAEFLKAAAQGWIEEHFGRNPPLPVTIVLETARQRLVRAAAVHVQLFREGWEMLDCPEKDFLIEDFGGLPLRGRIDRIDRHRETGAIRVIDYKTSDTGADPLKAHCRKARDTDPEIARFTVTGNGKEKTFAWTDLQLPLYRALVEANGYSGPVEVAYFNMPKAISETGVHVWEGLTDEIYQAARTCALQVVDAVRSCLFWPPAPVSPKYDDFEGLAAGDIPDFIAGQDLVATLRDRIAATDRSATS